MFFYYNNGITISCNSFKYIKTMRAPTIELENIQVVNGSQTIHALYDAFIEDMDKFEHIDILCRIYETKNPELSTNIAEYTNSQNPVKSRDIRSIDFIQLKLELEFKSKGLFYERKRNFYSNKDKKLRLDAEKAGQVLMALYNKMPSEAKNKKSLIFGDKYDDVFNESLTAEKVLLAYRLFERIETEKNKTKIESLSDPNKYEKESYIMYASYYILYILGELSTKESIILSYDNIDKIWKLYPDCIKMIESIIEKERRKDALNKYTHAAFFKSNLPKKYIEDLLEDDSKKS